MFSQSGFFRTARFAIPLLLAIASISRPASAAHKVDAGGSVIVAPKLLGHYGDWHAAKHAEAGDTACYAFAYPEKSQPAMRGRGQVVLTVTNRPGERHVVALTSGYLYPANSAPTLTADKTNFTLYTTQSSAFAHDGAAVVKALAESETAKIESPAPRGNVADSFSLKGFDRALAAIDKDCPATE